MRNKIVAGNWKMNLDWQEAIELGNNSLQPSLMKAQKRMSFLQLPFYISPCFRS